MYSENKFEDLLRKDAYLLLPQFLESFCIGSLASCRISYSSTVLRNNTQSETIETKIEQNKIERVTFKYLNIEFPFLKNPSIYFLHTKRLRKTSDNIFLK